MYVYIYNISIEIKVFYYRFQQVNLKQGYIGHIIAIANEIMINYEANDFLLKFLQTNLPETVMQKWEMFVKTKLDEINKKQQLSLVSLY